MPESRTRVLRIGTGDDVADEATIREAAELIRAGGLVAFPTETVYGLGADAKNAEAVRRIFEAKGRPATNPLIVHAATPEMAVGCVAEWPDAAQLLAERFWPGPLTLVLPRAESIPDIVTAGGPTVGVRVPSNKVARRLIEAAGRPIAAPSANRSTGISPTCAEHVLKDLDGRIELVLDGGRTDVGIESTVVDLSTLRPRILRPGHITAEAIEHATGLRVHETGETAGALKSPGQMSVHYAPRTRTRCVSASRLAEDGAPAGAGVIVLGDADVPTGDALAKVVYLNTPGDAERSLYAWLHLFEEAGLEEIVLVLPPETEEWHAVADRVRRAGGREA